MIYLDNSATTRQHDQVTDIMLKYMREDFGNPSSLYSLGVTSEKAVKEVVDNNYNVACIPTLRETQAFVSIRVLFKFGKLFFKDTT